MLHNNVCQKLWWQLSPVLSLCVCGWVVGGRGGGGCDVIFNITEGVTTLAQNLKLLKPERERSREKNQRTGDWTLQIADEKELALYLDPWEESLEFSKSIQSMKKHYFYSHQKPTKLVYEICLIPIVLIVLWGKLKNKFMIFALHRISSIN